MANLVLGGMSVDCPHRERLGELSRYRCHLGCILLKIAAISSLTGYLGDAHTTLETALNTIASDRFYRKWLTDIIDIQG